jgi:NADPH-dependent 2,4-dienoyl-CoA reductase/sulfur reductase-like enzyme/bacterioferritin-associated ferredoxin
MECELAVVGAGPAGISAALIASRLGMSAVVVDEGAEPGGQYYRYRPGIRSPRKVESFRKAIRTSPLLTYLPGTSVWHIEPGFRIYLDGPSGADVLFAKSVILATGAWERAVPFQGWDLPGVLTAGAIQSLLKGQGVLAGRPMVLAGGPFVLTVAREVLAAGGEVSAVALAGSPSLWQLAGLASSRIAVVREAASALGLLVRRRVPVYVGWVVREAFGNNVLRGVALTRYGRGWSSVAGGEVRVPARVLGVSYGFVSATQLAQLAGCRMVWDPLRFQWLPQHNGDLETTVRGLYVAGEAAGVAGAEVAEIEGELAALCAFARLRGSSRALSEARNRLQSRREKARAWAGRLLNVWSLGLDLYRLTTGSCTVCRCEGVKAADVLEALSEGVSDLNSLKALTRVGMGPCQGRFCEPTLIAMAAQRLGVRPEEVKPFSVRPPVMPVEAGRLAQLAPADAPPRGGYVGNGH